MIKAVLLNPYGFKLIPRRQFIDGDFSEYYIFVIYRDFVDKAISIFKNFTKDNIYSRETQMMELFNLNRHEVKTLPFTRFLELAIKHRDHHWESQYNYLHFPGKVIHMFNLNNLEPLRKSLQVRGFNLNYSRKINQSCSFKVIPSEKDLQLIECLFDDDYKHADIFKEK